MESPTQDQSIPKHASPNNKAKPNVDSPTNVDDLNVYTDGGSGKQNDTKTAEQLGKEDKKIKLVRESRQTIGRLLQALDDAPEPPQARGGSPAFSKTPLKAYSSSETVTYEAFKNSGGIRCVVLAVRKYNTACAVVDYGCQALASFAIFDDTAVTDMMISGVVEGAVSSFEKGSKLNEDAKVSVLKLLRTLTQKEEHRSEISKAHGTESVVKMMINSPKEPRALSHGALLLSNLTFGNKELKDAVGNLGGIAAIAKAMSDHPAQQTMQARGSLALRNLCFGSESNQKAAGQCGAVEALVGAVQLHGGDREIVHQSSVALVNLSNESPLNRNKIVAAGAASTFVQLMTRYSTSMTVHDDCLAVLRNIVVESKTAQDEVGKGGGIDTIVKALDKFRKEEKLCTKACAALRYLCFQEENRRLVGERGGMSRIVNVLKQHKRSAGAIEHALLAIGNATFENEENKKTVGECGGLSAIVSAIEQHRLNPTIQEHGCRVMRNLVADSKENANRAVEHGGITAGVFAMMGYADNASVQEQACAMLVNMAECEGVIVKFQQADVMRLAERALTNHSKHRGVQLQAGVLIDRLNGYDLITPRGKQSKGGFVHTHGHSQGNHHGNGHGHGHNHSHNHSHAQSQRHSYNNRHGHGSRHSQGQQRLSHVGHRPSQEATVSQEGASRTTKENGGRRFGWKFGKN